MRIADGTIAVLGRGASVINTGGEKVHAEEVERTLCSHPGVRDAVVVGIPHDRWCKQVVGIVELHPDAPRTGGGGTAGDPGGSAVLADITGCCGSRPPSYEVPRVPHQVDQIRRTASGTPHCRWARGLVHQLHSPPGGWPPAVALLQPVRPLTLADRRRPPSA